MKKTPKRYGFVQAELDKYADEKVAAFRQQVAASIRSHGFSLPANIQSNPKDLLFLISDLIAEGKMP